jgi:hypothetical protein
LLDVAPPEHVHRGLIQEVLQIDDQSKISELEIVPMRHLDVVFRLFNQAKGLLNAHFPEFRRARRNSSNMTPRTQELKLVWSWQIVTNSLIRLSENNFCVHLSCQKILRALILAIE